MQAVSPLRDYQQVITFDAKSVVLRVPVAKAERGCKFSIARDKNGPGIKLKKRCNGPKTLVCHDMKGGYLEDRFVDGAYGLPTEPYTFVHWPSTDIFVYFSHHFVTIPPLGWISAAHRNGVQILGTIITEFDHGEHICEQVLQSKATVDFFVEKCVEIAVAYGFDGWLLNIENPVKNVDNLLYLTEKLAQRMHEKVLDSCVLWYDSVTIDGELKWQNALNSLNSQFFHACDGIFLNYTWTEDGLVKSAQFSPERKSDIFVGLDVFGRGCPGDGGFTSNVAMEIIHKLALSTAIFAPGWTHECASKDTQPFPERDQKFWSLLEPFLTMKGLTSIDSPVIFNRGCGKSSQEGWWLNLTQQSAFADFDRTGEIFCDLRVTSELKIALGLKQPLSGETIVPKLLLIFDENWPVFAEGKEASSVLKYEVQAPANCLCLHFVRVMSQDWSMFKSIEIIAS